MVCASVREDNPKALASGLSSSTDAQTKQLLAYCYSMQLHLMHCEIFQLNIEISMQVEIMCFSDLNISFAHYVLSGFYTDHNCLLL